MTYITSKRYRGKTMQGIEVNIPALTEAEETNNVISINGKPVCFATSLVAHQYFARNDDKQGMKRGKLTYAIAFSERKRTNTNGTRVQRFTDEEIEILSKKWQKYLKPLDVILFNHEFFEAEISELEEMAKDLHIVTRGKKCTN